MGALAVEGRGGGLAEMVRDPLTAFGQRSPGHRPAGALFQTKPSKAPPPPLAMAPPLAPPEVSGLVPPVTKTGDDAFCEQLTRPATAVVLAPVSPEVEALASRLVVAVRGALADNPAGGQPEREDAVERGIERVLVSANATPEDARSALQIVQLRLAALGLTCAPGVPQAMQVASVAVSEAAKPGGPASDFQPAATGQPGPGPIPLPPASGGGGGGGGVTHPGAL